MMAQNYVYHALEATPKMDTNSNYILQKLDIKIEEDYNEYNENTGALNYCTVVKQEPENILLDELQFINSNHINMGDNIKNESCSDSVNQINVEQIIDIKQEELIIKSESSDIPKRRKHYQCEHCNYATKSIADFRRHTVAIHDRKNAEIFQCLECDFVTCHKRNLNRHFRIHSNNQTHACEVCNKGFTTKQLLDNHILKHHCDQMHLITSKIHSCEICKYSTVCRTRLEDHMHTRHLKTREDVYTCYNCNFRFTCKESLRYHIISKHVSTASKDSSGFSKYLLQCKLCKYKTTDKSNFQKHARTHTGIRRSFSCSGCMKTFTDKKCYDNHILKTHPEDRDLMKTITYKIKKCDICNYQTSIATNFKTHIEKHHR